MPWRKQDMSELDYKLRLNAKTAYTGQVYWPENIAPILINSRHYKKKIKWNKLTSVSSCKYQLNLSAFTTQVQCSLKTDRPPYDKSNLTYLIKEHTPTNFIQSV